VEDFVVGQYGRFDSLAARAAKCAKERHPNVTLTLHPPVALSSVRPACADPARV
jgi:hypothetical protein